jgi:hypothetical protein
MTSLRIHHGETNLASAELNKLNKDKTILVDDTPF